MLKVFIADDRISYRSQIEKRLSTLSRVDVVGSSRLNTSTFSLLDHAKADVLIIDLRESAEAENGFALLGEMQSKSLKIPSIIAMIHTREQETRAKSLGAHKIVLKQSTETGDESRVASLVFDLLNSCHSQVPTAGVSASKKSRPKVLDLFAPKAIVIASSTGGPPVLEAIFKQLAAPLDLPVFIAQHMPESFTRDLAYRLSSVSGLEVREAVQGETVQAGRVYVAPGNFHMRLQRTGLNVTIALDQEEKLHSVRPAADYLFKSASAIYGKDLLAFVLTGMGMDGADGALTIKTNLGRVVIQDKDSSAVWGMPGAAHALGAFDAIEGIDSISDILKLAMIRNAS